jgi:hypothetical protein
MSIARDALSSVFLSSYIPMPTLVANVEVLLQIWAPVPKSSKSRVITFVSLPPSLLLLDHVSFSHYIII